MSTIFGNAKIFSKIYGTRESAVDKEDWDRRFSLWMDCCDLHVAEIEKYKDMIVMSFDEEEIPEFYQGFVSHELLEPVTASRCSFFVETIARLRAENEQLRDKNLTYQENIKIRMEIARDEARNA